jgi:leucyl/phenylalanyl-tRNA---protein transferase
MTKIPCWLPPDDDSTPFPDVEQALIEPNGLLAVGGSLSVTRLLDAYRHGIFPWYSADQPLLWWSPDPRTVLFPTRFKLSRSLRKTLQKCTHEVTLDTAFDAVVAACAAPRDSASGTWITSAMAQAYCTLHAAGYAHSVEVWRDGKLAGGLYGVALGRVFFGESMFSAMRDGSKIALAHLAGQLRAWDFAVIDCQLHTAHLQSLGAEEIPRRHFTALLRESCALPGRPGPWRFESARPWVHTQEQG